MVSILIQGLQPMVLFWFIIMRSTSILGISQLNPRWCRATTWLPWKLLMTRQTIRFSESSTLQTLRVWNGAKLTTQRSLVLQSDLHSVRMLHWGWPMTDGPSVLQTMGISIRLTVPQVLKLWKARRAYGLLTIRVSIISRAEKSTRRPMSSIGQLRIPNKFRLSTRSI